MNETKAGASASAPNVRTLWQRLRPFVRRDLQGRLISASITAIVLAGLAWFGISAFTHLDSADAQALRVELGLERAHAVCGRSDGPSCSYDDRAQAKIDADWQRDVEIRSAILFELDLRLADGLAKLEAANELLEVQEFDFSNGRPAGGDVRLAELLEMPDLAPMRSSGLYVDGVLLDKLSDAATYDPYRDASPAATKALLISAIAAQEAELRDFQRTVGFQRDREPELDVSAMTLDRDATIIDLQVHEDRYGMSLTARDWFAGNVGEDLSRAAFNLANRHTSEFTQALLANNEIWDGGWQDARWTERYPPTVRYHSPISDSTRYRLAGLAFFAIACFVFVVVSPIVTATATAREREAGTLPVLRMTGMSAGELAMAMVVGPNVFAGVLGGALLFAGTGLLAMTLPVDALLLPMFLLVVLATATHLTAIGLGDALGQRVNAMVVGGLLGVAIVVPGLLGAALAAFDVAATGLLLGPLPAITSSIADISGFNGVGLTLSNELTVTMLGFALASQALLGLICLNSWRRRVEQGWAPLFRPIEGVLLALVSIGSSALTLLDINHHHQAQDFDALNLLTFLSSAFLLPLLAWLLVASLRRPARAHAVADHVEARWAFLRFQGFLAVSALLVGGTYYAVMNQAGLSTDDSEVMWATLSQLLLAAETGVATLLWASRRREGKLRVAFLGGAVVLMQIGAVFGTYGLEVEHVARTNSAAAPLLANAEISGYWLAFMVLCWGAGLALIFTALMRRRDEKRAAAQAEAASVDADVDDDDGMPGRRLLH